jgi:hypothetical protein
MEHQLAQSLASCYWCFLQMKLASQILQKRRMKQPAWQQALRGAFQALPALPPHSWASAPSWVLALLLLASDISLISKGV